MRTDDDDDAITGRLSVVLKINILMAHGVMVMGRVCAQCARSSLPSTQWTAPRRQHREQGGP